jgi:hypothetical protein
MSCSRSETVNSSLSSASIDCLSVVDIRILTRFNTVRYSHSRLLEINSHSLFSRWFSESGKLVQRLFSSITEMVDEEDTFVVVLIGLLFFGQLLVLADLVFL